MRIIHYIDSIKAGNLLSDYLLRLTTAQKEYADVKTITQQGDFKKLLADFQPDIVRLHNKGISKSSLLTSNLTSFIFIPAGNIKLPHTLIGLLRSSVQ